MNHPVTSGYRASMAMATSNARTIQTGDTLYFRQYQHNAHGGMYINFYYGEEAIVDVYDQNGEVISDASPQNQWEPRWVPLDGSTGGGNYVGKTIVNLNAINEVNAPDGAFDMYFADVAIVNRLTGEVWPVLDAGASGELTPAGQVWPADQQNGYGPVYSLPLGNEGAVTNVVGAVEKSSTDPSGQPVAATHYYLDDHLGTAQVELSSGGWPVWQGQFTPFGAELDQQFTAMHYKFTGKERDAESGLDFFGARYYASTAGRWMSPDWAAKPEAVPYSSLGDPQSLNLYGYVGNNPLARADADGHIPDWVKGAWDGVKSGVSGTAHGLVTVVLAAHGDLDAMKEIGSGVAGMAKNGYNQVRHPLQTARDVKAGWKSMSSREKAALITDTNVKALIAAGTTAVGGEIAGAGEAGVGETFGMAPKIGEIGGPGAGKVFSRATHAAAADENAAAFGGQTTCVYCREAVGPGTENPMHIDHAEPRVNGGNNSLNNAQVTCQYCNLSKGTGTAPKNPKNPN